MPLEPRTIALALSAGTESNQSHEANHLLSHHHLRRFTHTEMDIREPFSRLKKKIKHRLTGSKHKPDKIGADASGERADGPLPRPGPHVVAGGGRDQEGSGSNAVGEQVFSTNPPPQPDKPEPVSGDKSENDQEEGDADLVGREGSQRNSMGSGPGREGNGADGGKAEQVDPSPSTSSLVRGGKPDGM